MMRTCLLGTSLILASIGVTHIIDRQSDPVYERRSLQSWAHLLVAEPVENRHVLAAIGPQLVPYLLAEIERSSPDGLFYEAGMGLYKRSPLWLQRRFTRPVSHTERWLNAMGLLGDLGS